MSKNETSKTVAKKPLSDEARGKLLARVYALVLSPEWQEDAPPSPPLKRQVSPAADKTHE